MSKDDYIYSYVERKLIDSRGTYTFDKQRYKDEKISKGNRGNLLGILTKMSFRTFIVVGIMIIIDLSK